MNVNTTFSQSAIEAATPKLEQLKKATDGFEAMFYKNLLSEMQKSVHKTIWGDQAGADTYQDMFTTALAESASKRGSLGIGKLLFDQLSPRVLAQEEATVRLAQANNKAKDSK
jgi:Rod binding domain-containing protein